MPSSATDVFPKPTAAVRVQARRERANRALSESEDDQFRSVGALLDDPLEVFERRLEVLTDLSESEASEIRVAFRELYQIHLDSEGGSTAKPLLPEKETES
jgi:hypothetical protein